MKLQRMCVKEPQPRDLTTELGALPLGIGSKHRIDVPRIIFKGTIESNVNRGFLESRAINGERFFSSNYDILIVEFLPVDMGRP